MKAIFCAAMFALPSPLLAQSDTVPWKEVAGWTIRMDPTMGNACYLSTVYEDGTILRLGFNFLEGKCELYFSFGNAKWKSLEEGKEYPVRIQFDDETPWEAKASAAEINSYKYLQVGTHDPNFLVEFSKKLGLKAFYADKQIIFLRLKGSSKAIDEMLECQDTTDKLVSTQKSPPKDEDPFTAPPSVKTSDDPFEL
ncbi:hypothetical protein QE369_004267 [Agrobacterium larrymoorei]|uniref:Uncharacterized protein n=1 Tax=Agrobacterium larrymoorei TaxID=160699 RepID=A0AAJ2BCK4_9HYPH|nr:hypothetical protein [Agrobacterium larrymoorei]MDR6104070.1 hypothetical protein [Agrobacterium larrymoorei]